MSRPDVGYCRPPEEHQFKPGASGNPKGRPPRKETVYETAGRVLAEPVRATSGGKPVKLSTIKAMFRRTCTDALRGDARAMKVVFELIFTIQPPGFEPGAAQQADTTEMLKRAAKVFGVDLQDVMDEVAKASRPPTPEEKRRGKWMDEKVEARKRELVAADRAGGKAPDH